MKIKDFIKIVDEIVPFKLTESWDNSGLIVGDENCNITKALLAIDITDEVLDYAISNEYNLILSHHPMIFKSLKVFQNNDKRSKLLSKSILNNLNIIGLHTPLDLCEIGTHETLADLIEMNSKKIIEPIFTSSYFKLITFVPKSHVEIVFEAITKSGAGQYGDYEACTFKSSGEGTFMPIEQANPYIGALNRLERVAEIKLEAIVSEENIDEVVKVLKEVHPYEEVAFDLIKLENLYKTYGHGRVGNINSISSTDLILKLKEKLKCEYIQFYGNKEKLIEKVAICCGSGESLINKLNDIDLYISADLRTTKILDLIDKDINVIDVGHYYSERPVLERLKKNLDKISCNLEIKIVDIEMDNGTLCSFL